MNPSERPHPPPADPNFYEDLRRAYEPTQVDTLFVGEAKPIGERFFYKGNSILFRATQTAFAQAFDRDFGPPTDFLDFFRDQGCYFINLIDQPVNQYKPTDPRRKQLRQAGVDRLAARMQAYAPSTIICVRKDIAPYVRAAHQQSRLQACQLHVLRFPRYYLQSYVADLTDILIQCRRTAR